MKKHLLSFATVAIVAAGAFAFTFETLTFNFTTFARVQGSITCSGSPIDHCVLQYDSQYDQYRAKIFAAITDDFTGTSVSIDHDNDPVTPNITIPVTLVKREVQFPA